ncbi:MAG TPA: hypothetical protein PK710_06215 [Polyangiaceae bacterium]|jgi:hypothetical protein|nr:MAG: hypothetical protein BWY17_02077 [Deltaproteobacteria bacterium ADurb.Bin207]HOT09344.1 hypothetical protein [Polyangiaceae bacterium]HPB95335.1 hypothetical protein [Polyangiaceae bacterium]HPY18597.1 hypothetical protein [Polyangiaceae bacterium]HQB44499.1 hypothetical protein [Polyangiaceae bacterium]
MNNAGGSVHGFPQVMAMVPVWRALCVEAAKQTSSYVPLSSLRIRRRPQVYANVSHPASYG